MAESVTPANAPERLVALKERSPVAGALVEAVAAARAFQAVVAAGAHLMAFTPGDVRRVQQYGGWAGALLGRLREKDGAVAAEVDAHIEKESVVLSLGEPLMAKMLGDPGGVNVVDECVKRAESLASQEGIGTGTPSRERPAERGDIDYFT